MQRAPASPYSQPKAASTGDKLSLVKAVLLFLLPFASLVQVQVVGTLYGLDILLGLTLLVTLASRNSPKTLGQMKWALVLMGVWLLGAVLSDWWVAAPFEDWSRGLAKLLFFGVALASIWLLTGGRARELSIMMGGFGLAAIVGVWVSPSGFATQDPWKFGIGGGLLYFTIFATTIPSVRRAIGIHGPPVAVFVIGLLSLIQNSRSLAMAAIMAAAYSLFAILVNRKPAIAKMMTPASFTIMLVVGLLSVQVLAAGYGTLAKSGVLGRAAAEKYDMQTVGGDISLLLGGRSETLVSIEAIKDSPIVGHGSWAKDPHYTLLYFDKLNELGIRTISFEYFGNESYLIPSHSHLFGAWVEHGVLGVLFWIFVLILALRSLYSILKANAVPGVMVAVSAFLVIWDVLFSPFGGGARFDKALQICILLAAVQSLGGLRGLAGQVRTKRRPRFGVRQAA